jgi:WD40 repeat protein
MAVAGGLDSPVQIWDVAAASVVKRLLGHSGWVTSVALSADGRVALSGSVDDTVRVWDVGTGACLHVLRGHTDDVRAVAVQGAGRWAVSGGYDNTIRVWDLSNGQGLRVLEGHTSWVSSVALGMDSRIVLSASYDGSVRVWDAPTGRCLHAIGGHDGRVMSVSASADARRAISGGADGKLRFWDVAKGERLATFIGHTGEVLSVGLSADARFAISGGADRTLRVWDTERGRCLRTFEGHAKDVSAAALSGDTSLAVTVSVDRSLRAWNIRGLCFHGLPAPPALSRLTSAEASLEAESAFLALLRRSREALAADRAEEALALASDARHLPGRDRDPDALRLWTELACRGRRTELKSAWCVRALSGQSSGVKALAVTLDGRCVASAEREGPVRVREIATGRSVLTLDGHTHGVSDLAVCPDGQGLASVGGDGRLCVWNLASGACERVIEGFEPNGEGLAISDDQRWILRGNGPRIGLWEFATGRQVRSYPAPSSMLMSGVAFLPGGEQAVVATIDYKTQLFELAGGRVTGIMPNCGPIAASPDGTLVAATGLEDGTPRVVTWDIASGNRQMVLAGHAAQITAMAFAPDSRWLMTAGLDNTVRVWDLSTGTVVRVLEGFIHPASTLAICPDGGQVAIGCQDGTVQVWALDWALSMRPTQSWDDAAMPIAAAFLRRHRPPAGELPSDRPALDEELAVALARRGTASWTEDDLDGLMNRLRRAGFGHLQRDGVLARLRALSAPAASAPRRVVPPVDAARTLRKGADRTEAEALPLLAGVVVEGNDLHQVGQIIVSVWRSLADTLETGKGAGGRSPSIPDLALAVFGNTCQLSALLTAVGHCPSHVVETVASVRRLALDLMPDPSLPETVVFYARKVRETAEALEAAFRSPLQALPTEPLDMTKLLQQLVAALRAYPDLLARGLDGQGRPATRQTLARLLADVSRGGMLDQFQQVYKSCFGAQYLGISGGLNNMLELSQIMEAQLSDGVPAQAVSSEPGTPAAPPVPAPAPAPREAPPRAVVAPAAAPAAVAPPDVGVECPKCGAAGQRGAECGSCGLLFARYRPGAVLKRAVERLRLVARQTPRAAPVIVEIFTAWEGMPDILETGRTPSGEETTPVVVGLLVRDNADMLEDRMTELLGECPAQLRSLLPEMRRLSRYVIGDIWAPATRATFAGTVANAATAIETVFAQPERPFPVTDQGVESKVILSIFVNVFKALSNQLTAESDPAVVRVTAEGVVSSCVTMLSPNVMHVMMYSCPTNIANVFKAINMIRTVARLAAGE